MGCNNSKNSSAKFALTDVQKKSIQENAQAIVLTSSALRVGATNAALHFTGNRTATALATDTTPLRTYFQSEVPHEIGDGSKSLSDIVAQLKKMSFENATGKLGPQIELSHPKVKTDVELQKAVRQSIQLESDAAAHAVILDMIEKCLNTASRQPDPKAVEHAAVPQSRGAAAGGGASSASPAAYGRGPAGAAAGGKRGGAGAAGGNNENDEVVLPKGDWEKAEGTPYYYSATENLYFHPPSSQFYDPSNGMWYDPDLDEWYQEDE